jgi:ribosomal protein S18 acetylase RimI-like enzyme
LIDNVTHKETSTMRVNIPTTVRLRDSDREALEAHFLSLDGEDRRLRFGAPIGDDGLRAYVARIDFERDGLFAVQDDDLRPLAVLHIGFGDGSAELGLSVVPEARGQGLGGALFERAVMHLRNRGTPQVFVHCLTENGAMMHLARKHGMRIIPAGFETDAKLALGPPTPQSIFAEMLHDYGGVTVRRVRENARLARVLMKAFAPA